MNKKKLIAILTLMCFIFTLVPVAAFASTTSTTEEKTVFYPGEEINVTLTGSGTQDVTISGYMNPEDWYVTDGLVLMYDGIYNAGMGKTDYTATSWTELTGKGPSLPISGQTWSTTSSSLIVKDTAISAQSITNGIELPNGFTWDYSFSRGDVSESTAKAYRYHWNLSVDGLSNLGPIREDGILLFYGSGTNWYNTAGSFAADDFAQVTLVSKKNNANSETRLLYRDGMKKGSKDITYPVSVTNTTTQVTTTYENYPGYKATKIAIPTYTITTSAKGVTPEVKENVSNHMYGMRLYNCDLSVTEIAQNAAIDRARYVDKNYETPGTIQLEDDAAVNLMEYDFTAKKIQTTVSDVSFDNASTDVTLKLNKTGEYALTFEVGDTTIIKKITVIDQADAEVADVVAAQIGALPESSSIQISDKDAVVTAQNAYNALSAVQQARVGAVLADKLEACALALDTAVSTVVLTYDTNGGTLPNGTADTVEIARNTTGFTLAVPTHNNAVFAGWYLDDMQLTGVDGKATIEYTNLEGATITAKWIANSALQITKAEDIYALARILANATPDSSLDSDYQRFGYNTASAEAYAALQTASYVLANDITLTNDDFSGIPNFMGIFDGQNNTITLTLDFSKYTGITQYGGVFKSIKGATIKNIILDGSGTGTFTLTNNTTDTGLLVGSVVKHDDAKPSLIENVTSKVTLNIRLDSKTSYCTYIAAIVGRMSADNQGFKLVNCINKGDYTVNVVNAPSNPCRVGGLIGHSNKDLTLERCANYGNITINGGTIYGGDLLGTGSTGTIFKDCVSAGNVSIEKGSLNIFNGMSTATTQSDNNVIRLTVNGQSGERITAIGNVDVTLTGTGNETVDLPIYYLDESTRLYTNYNADQSIDVAGKGSIYLFDLGNKTFTTAINTDAAAESAMPFSNWETAIPLSTEKHFLTLQKAINDGDEAAIKAMYVLGGKDAAAVTDLDTARIVLRSAYYVLQNDVTIDDTAYTGIGNANHHFGGHFDGGNHTVTLKLAQAPDNITEKTYFGLFGNMNVLTDGMVEVKDLNLAVELNVSVPANGFTVYVGGLAGSAIGLTVDNVNVTVNGVTVSDTSGASTVHVGGVFGYENILATTPMTVTINGSFQVMHEGTNTIYIGGFAGQTNKGAANVRFIGNSTGISVSGSGSGSTYLGAVAGYSSGSNDFSGVSVINETGNTIYLTGTKNGSVGLLLAYHTTTSALSDTVVLKADNVSVDGDFSLTSRYVGGLFGHITTNGIVQISNVAVGGAYSAVEGASVPKVGGLLGNAPSSSAYTPTFKFDNCLYVKTDTVTKAVGNVSTDPAGVTVLDSTAWASGATFGTPITVLSANAPSALTISDNAVLSGKELTINESGSNVAVTFMWNNVPFYTATVNVAAKDLTDDTNVAVAGGADTYVSEEAAAADASNVTVIYNGSALVKDTDYTVTQGTNEFVVTFQGNYAGTASKQYSIDTQAVNVTVTGYTGEYDAQEHGVTVTAADGATVKYSTEAANYTDTVITRKNVGTTVVYWEATNGSKTPVHGSATITITPAPLTATYVGETIKVGTTPTLAVNVTGFVNGETVGTAAGYEAPEFMNVPTTVGTHALTPIGGSADNYEFTTYVGGTLTILPATGQVIPGDTVNYIVEHYKGSATEPAEVEYLGGKIGATVTAVPKTYDGYTYNADKSTASGTLKAIASSDDIVTLKLYYDIMLVAEGTVEGDTVNVTISGGYAGENTNINGDELGTAADAIVVDATNAGTGADTATNAVVTLPQNVAKDFVEHSTVVTIVASIGAGTEDVTSITLDKTALNKVAATSGADAKITITPTTVANAAAAVEITVTVNDVAVLPVANAASNGTITIELPYAGDTTPFVYFVENGKIREKVDSTWDKDAKKVVAKAKHLSTYAVYGTVQQVESDTVTSTGSSSGFTGKYNYPVTVTEPANGEAKADKFNAVEGATVTITTKAEAGYGVYEVIVTDADGDRIPTTDLNNGQYTFTMPNSEVKVQVVCKPAITMVIDSVYINVFGKTIKNDVTPKIVDGRTVLPIRVVAEALGADVDWDPETQKVTITKGDTVIELFIGKYFAYVNGEVVELDVAPFIENSRTYLPVRFVSEYLGAMVNWDAATRTVTIIPE